MKFSHHNTTESPYWHTYKALELISDAVEDPQANCLKFSFGLKQIWRLLLVALTQELVYDDQRIEYLERCWAVNELEAYANTLQKLWALMN